MYLNYVKNTREKSVVAFLFVRYGEYQANNLAKTIHFESQINSLLILVDSNPNIFRYPSFSVSAISSNEKKKKDSPPKQEANLESTLI